MNVTALGFQVSNTNSMDAVLEVFSKQPAVRSDEDVGKCGSVGVLVCVCGCVYIGVCWC